MPVVHLSNLTLAAEMLTDFRAQAISVITDAQRAFAHVWFNTVGHFANGALTESGTRVLVSDWLRCLIGRSASTAVGTPPEAGGSALLCRLAEANVLHAMVQERKPITGPVCVDPVRGVFAARRQPVVQPISPADLVTPHLTRPVRVCHVSSTAPATTTRPHHIVVSAPPTSSAAHAASDNGPGAAATTFATLSVSLPDQQRNTAPTPMPATSVDSRYTPFHLRSTYSCDAPGSCVCQLSLVPAV